MTTDLLYSLNIDPRSSAKSARRIAGYCYAHPWKTKKAYATTLETTIYLHPDYTAKGYGKPASAK